MESTNNSLVALSVYLSGGAVKQIDIEHIADTAYQLAPARFCWKHFPDRIDLRTVQYALKNAIKEDSPKIQGSMRHGYQMTPSGIEWAMALIEHGSPEIDKAKSASQTEQLQIERKRLRHTAAYRKIHAGAGGGVTRRDFEAFVRINEYFAPELRQERIRRIDNAVQNQDDLEHVWCLLKERFVEASR